MQKANYTHLTQLQRCQIQALNKREILQSVIAEDIGVSQSTISRELRRCGKDYCHIAAQKSAVQRRLYGERIAPVMTPALIERVENLLILYKWSPEQISGRLKLEHGIKISHESIYSHIWQDKRAGGELYLHLRQRGKKRNKRGSKNAGRGLIPNRIDIAERPPIVDAKSRVGDWELDSVIGAKHKGAITTMVERKSKLTKLVLLKGATKNETRKAIIKRLKPIKKFVLTLTSDNGKEFAGHQQVSKKLEADFYFCTPYHSWERGLNENTNGLLRQFFPKGMDFANITPAQVQKVEDLLNNRPRKTLGYLSPNEVFNTLTDNNLYALRI